MTLPLQIQPLAITDGLLMGVWIRQVPWNSPVHLLGQKCNTLPYDTPKILLKRPVKMLHKKRNKKDAQSLLNSKEFIRQGTQMVKYRQVGTTAQSLAPFGQYYIHWCSSLPVWSYSLWASEICWDPSEKAKKQQQTELPENPAQNGEVWDQTLHSKNLKNRTTQLIRELGQDF